VGTGHYGDAERPRLTFHVFPLPQDPSARINAALAVAVLVGKCEEKSSKLQLDESLVVLLLEVLESACVVSLLCS
jgi:hypothetical protein